MYPTPSLGSSRPNPGLAGVPMLIVIGARSLVSAQPYGETPAAALYFGGNGAVHGL